jgi:hypothetical protein
MEGPQNIRFCFDVYGSSPLARLHRWKENNICQSIWVKNEVFIWRTCWGTYWEPIRNLEGTHWETSENEEKILPTPPNLKGIKARHLGPSHWLKGKQILPLAPPSPVKLAWKVHCPLSKWTLDSPLKYSLKQKPPLKPPTQLLGTPLGNTLRIWRVKIHWIENFLIPLESF